jgi:hypothetical protein
MAPIWFFQNNKTTKMFVKDEIKKLLQIVPRPPGSDIPPGADEESIKQLAMLFSEPLPEELVEWFQLCNGPCIGPGGVFGVAPASN